jgi:hypothetical protein
MFVCLNIMAPNRYMWPERALPPLPQAMQLLQNLRDGNAEYSSVMLDIEGDNWGSHSAASNQEFVMTLVNAFADAKVPVAIYCGWQFESFFGANFTSLNHLPLIYAHYDNTPSYIDIADNLFGGWSLPSGKQFFDGANGEQVCGSGGLDWDWSQTPWW